MADNPRYSDTGIGYSGAASTPGVDPIGMRAKAQMTGDISGLLDRMAGSLYKVAAEEAQREGLQWGAANPVTVDQLNAAVAAGQDPLANRFTYFGEAARKVQATVLGQNLNSQGVGEMARIQAEAEIGKIPLSVAAEKMDAVSNAYAKTLAGVDAETGVKLRAALTTHSSSVYAHLAQAEVKKFQAAQKASIDDYFGQLPMTLETVFMGGDITGPDGITKTAGDLAQVQRAQAVQAARITGDATYGTKFDKALSDAKINAFTKIAADPTFARNSTEALGRLSSGNLPPQYKSTWVGMTAEEQTKVKTQYMQASSFEYTAKERAERDDKDARGRDIAAMVTEMYMPGTPAARQRELARTIATTNAQGIGGPVLEASTIKSMLKPDGEGAGSQGVVRAMEMIDRQGITDLNEVKRTGIKGGEIVKIQTHLYSKGDQHLNRQIKTMASIPDGIVQMNGDQQRRFDLLSQEAEILKARQIQEKGTYDPFTVVDDLRKRRDEITREKATDGAKARLENFPIKKGTVKLNLDTSADEMRRMKMSDSEIANAQRIQREGMGK